ncbi:uncharacterized protein JN550_006823 [Neoarthrinium moseri]|uniref:uncharacterized protein n=1 Tax=Neoarthrinium moseri TaxID=1658444 RepID=UPI001FDCD514|nr:uncharacterized protein JN550_006823 [Neoarthrinium moseri]KAI1867682.1 hypothetical protein JN550_006823 [Neoarthrinium moseri]
MSTAEIHIAIIGGGLCGLALAIALERRRISYTIYELQSTFSEIGAGLNVAPNAIAAFNAIEPKLGDAVMALGTRNSPNAEVWMVNRLGAPTDRFPDAHAITEIIAPGVGHTAVGRYELLNLLASKIDTRHARFRKKLTRVEQGEDAATLHFEDGTVDAAHIVIGCDGIHSAVRRSLVGNDHRAAEPRFTGIGGYRAVFPMDQLAEAIGPEVARTSCIWSGPGGYATMYSIEGGKKVNVGLWLSKEQYRERVKNDRWVLRKQKAEMLEDCRSWGPSIQKVMRMMGEETTLWTSHHHDMELDSYFKGRVCVIGDAAHSMGPHQGQGASQAMEDAYVMSVVLSQIKDPSCDHMSPLLCIEAAFSGWQEVRKPQAEWVLRTSHEAFDWWSSFWRRDLEEKDIEERSREATFRFRRIWDANVDRQGDVAKYSMLRSLQKAMQVAL